MTSIVDIVLRCPTCGGLSRDSALASRNSSLTVVWSDGYCTPYDSAVSFLRCGVCGKLNARSSFDFAGSINHGCHAIDLRLITMGPEPLKVMKRLRAAFGWDLAGVKARLASLPVNLPRMYHPEDALRLQAALLEDGAACEMNKVFTEAPDSPERLNAPWAQYPQHPSELSELVHHGMVDEFAARLCLYHLSNAPYRNPILEWVGLTNRAPFEVENIRALVGFLDDRDETHWLLRANIARESGDFSSAGELLSQWKPADEKVWHSCLQALVSERIERVSMLWLPGSERPPQPLG
jgi:hypothetical protein